VLNESAVSSKLETNVVDLPSNSVKHCGREKIFCIVQENNKNPNEISKLIFSPRAPTKKTKSKQQLSYTAQQLNDRNKVEATSATVSVQTQMALLQRQSAGKLIY
jgi:hypothetical protein